jgi:hypothetical protein
MSESHQRLGEDYNKQPGVLLERFRAKWISVRVRKRVKTKTQSPVLIPSEPEKL